MLLLPFKCNSKTQRQSEEKSYASYRALGCKWLWLIAAFRRPVWLERREQLEWRHELQVQRKGWSVYLAWKETTEWKNMLHRFRYRWDDVHITTDTVTTTVTTTVVAAGKPCATCRGTRFARDGAVFEAVVHLSCLFEHNLNVTGNPSSWLHCRKCLCTMFEEHGFPEIFICIQFPRHIVLLMVLHSICCGQEYNEKPWQRSAVKSFPANIMALFHLLMF